MPFQCDDAVEAPMPVCERNSCSSNRAATFFDSLLVSRIETSQVTKKASGMENKAGLL